MQAAQMRGCRGKGVAAHRQGQRHVSAAVHERLRRPDPLLNDGLVQGRRAVVVERVDMRAVAAQQPYRRCIAAQRCQVQRGPPGLSRSR